jgi:hypothetical protein
MYDKEAQVGAWNSKFCILSSAFLWNIWTAASQLCSTHYHRQKHSLMKLPSFIINLLIIIFLGLVSYGLTTSIAVKSTMGIILSLISLIATITFAYLLPKLYQQPADEERTDQ